METAQQQQNLTKRCTVVMRTATEDDSVFCPPAPRRRLGHHGDPLLPGPDGHLKHAGVVEVALVVGGLPAHGLVDRARRPRLARLQDEVVLAAAAANTIAATIAAVLGDEGAGAASREVGSPVEGNRGGVEEEVVCQVQPHRNPDQPVAPRQTLQSQSDHHGNIVILVLVFCFLLFGHDGVPRCPPLSLGAIVVLLKKNPIDASNYCMAKLSNRDLSKEFLHSNIIIIIIINNSSSSNHNNNE